MEDILNITLLFLIFVALILLAWIMSYYIRSDKLNRYTESTDSSIKNTSCLISLDSLPDVTSYPCCRNTVFPALRYDRINNVVLSTAPNYYLNACAGFCPGGIVDFNTKLCKDDPANQQFIACRDRITPKGCNGLALPVARSGTRYYFIASATDSLCPVSQRYPCII